MDIRVCVKHWQRHPFMLILVGMVQVTRKASGPWCSAWTYLYTIQILCNMLSKYALEASIQCSKAIKQILLSSLSESNLVGKERSQSFGSLTVFEQRLCYVGTTFLTRDCLNVCIHLGKLHKVHSMSISGCGRCADSLQTQPACCYRYYIFILLSMPSWYLLEWLRYWEPVSAVAVQNQGEGVTSPRNSCTLIVTITNNLNRMWRCNWKQF